MRTLSIEEDKEYGGWKRLGYALGHFAELVEQNERDGYFTVGLLATCPSMPGLVAGLQHSGAAGTPVRVGMLWLDAHPDFNTPETTRSGSLGGMPVAVATGRALERVRLDAHLDPPLADSPNKVPNGPSSEELARLFEMIFSRYSKASAIGFATIPATDEGGLSIAAVNRMIEGAIRGVMARERARAR